MALTDAELQELRRFLRLSDDAADTVVIMTNTALEQLVQANDVEIAHVSPRMLKDAVAELCERRAE